MNTQDEISKAKQEMEEAHKRVDEAVDTLVVETQEQHELMSGLFNEWLAAIEAYHKPISNR